jgi:hypothetical protein
MSETLHTCPDCGQPNFSASGLKSHQGGKTCKARAAAKSSDVVTLIEGYDAAAEAEYGLSKPKASLEGEAAACVSRFLAFHETVKGNVLAVKLAKFFGGIEVQTLCDLHAEIYGETRGGDQSTGKTDSESVLLETFLEERLGVTARTARRYKNHFLSCTQEKPELAEKLRKWWLKWKDDAALQLTASDAQTNKGKGKAGETQLVTAAPSALALHEVCNLAAKDVQELLDHADAWGLSELFEKPIKDVTPPAPDETEDDEGRDTTKERLAKFWLQDFCRRALNNEFLKLRKQDKEALLTTFEEAVTKLKSSLEPKGGKK